MTDSLSVLTTDGPAVAVALPTTGPILYLLESGGRAVLAELPERLHGDPRPERARRRELLAGVAEHAFR